MPIGKSISSRFYRAVETAQLIGGKEPEVTSDASEGGLVVSPNENNRRAQALRTIAATPPAAGTNTLVVTHKRDGNGAVTLIARVPIDQWAPAKK